MANLSRIFGLFFMLGTTTPVAFGQATISRFSDSTLAIHFGISSNFTLSSFSGSALSFKMHQTQSSAWRAGISFDAETGPASQTNQRFQADTTTNSDESEWHSSTLSISLDLMHLNYLDHVTTVIPYFGVGPVMGVSWRPSKEDRTNKPVGYAASSSSTKYSSTSISVGGNGLIGVEWFAAKDISLLAEYVIGVRYAWSKSTTEISSSGPPFTSGTKQESPSSRWSLLPYGVRFGLTAYIR